MNDRRNFLKQLISAGIGIGLGEWLLLATSTPPADEGKEPWSENFGYAWRRTIFCQVEHEGLISALKGCADDLGCAFYLGEPMSPDILAIGAFIVIVDRNSVGEEQWKDYVAYCDEVYEDTPCIIVDGRDDLPLPKTNYVAFLDLKKQDSIQKIVKTVKQLKEEMGKRLPEVFGKDTVYA